MGEIIRTALMATLTPRLARVHERRRIGVFAGPPGIGKTTAVRAFAEAYEGGVAIVTVPAGPKTGIRATAALDLVLEGLYDLDGALHRSTFRKTYIETRGRIYGRLKEWSDGDVYVRLTIVLDEAQNLSEEAIETLRYLNDDGVGYSPFPVGLVFIGNSTFRLKSGRNGQSILTDAVRDRALYADTFSHDDVTDDDLTLFMDLRGVVDPEAHRLVVRYFRAGKRDRSFRRLADLLDDLEEEAAGAPVCGRIVKAALGLG